MSERQSWLEHGGFLEEPRSSIESVRARLSPAEKLVFNLYSHFPDRDLRAMEEIAYEIEQARSVEMLESFSRTIRAMVKEFLYTQTLLERKRIQDTLKTFQEEALFSVRQQSVYLTSSVVKGRRPRLVKSILRSGEEAEVLSQGERLAERLGELVRGESRARLVAEVDAVSSREELEGLVSRLSAALRERSERNDLRVREAVGTALAEFAAAIHQMAAQYKQITNFLEALTKFEDEIVKGYSDDTTSRIYNLSKKIRACLYSSDDKVTEEVCINITEMVELVNQVKPNFSEGAAKKAVLLQRAVQNLSTCFE